MCTALTYITHQDAVLDVVPFLEAEVAEVAVRGGATSQRLL